MSFPPYAEQSHLCARMCCVLDLHHTLGMDVTDVLDDILLQATQELQRHSHISHLLVALRPHESALCDRHHAMITELSTRILWVKDLQEVNASPEITKTLLKSASAVAAELPAPTYEDYN